MPEQKGIGNPLRAAAESGVMGAPTQERRPITSRENPSTSAPTQVEVAPATQKPTEEKGKPERVKVTIIFSPERRKWLRVTSAQHEKDMSDIVEEALELWQRMNPEEKK